MTKATTCWVLVLALTLGACAIRPTGYQTPEGALGPYSGAAVSGQFVFVSGKVGPAGLPFADQVRGAIEGIDRSMQRAGLKLNHVVMVTVYLTDMDRYDEFNDIYAEIMPQPYPARACVEVSALPGDRLVEVVAIASRR